MKALVFAVALIPSVALAQQPQQQSISEFTLETSTRVNQLGQAAENLQKQNAQLQTQLAAANKRIEELTKPKIPAVPSKPTVPAKP